jgi:hypothetical protein
MAGDAESTDITLRRSLTLASGWQAYVSTSVRFLYRVSVDPLTWKVKLEIRGEREGKVRCVVTQVSPDALQNRAATEWAAVRAWNPPPSSKTSAPLFEGDE